MSEIREKEVGKIRNKDAFDKYRDENPRWWDKGSPIDMAIDIWIAAEEASGAKLEEKNAKLEYKLHEVLKYARDRAFHARGHLNTVNTGRIATDLFHILGVKE